MSKNAHKWCADFGIVGKFWMADPTAEEWTTEGDALYRAVQLARQGYRQGLPDVVHLLDSQDAYVQHNAQIYVGSFATEPELVEIIHRFGDAVHDKANARQQLMLAEILFHSKYLWAGPLMLRLAHDVWCSSPREHDSFDGWIGNLLLPPHEHGRPYIDPYVFPVDRHRDSKFLDEWLSLQLWRERVEAIGNVHTPIFHGQPFDIRHLAQLHLEHRTTRYDPNRWVYESVTGAECTNWYDSENRHQPLQIEAEMERFLAEDAQRYEVGKRYFLGQEVPQIDDPRTIELMNDAIAWFEQKLQTIEPKYLVRAGILEEPEEEDEDPGYDQYTYGGIDTWRTNPNGDIWDRLSHTVHEARAGRFELMLGEVLRGARDGEANIDFDLFAIRTLADACPSQQLRELPTVAEQQPQPRWLEFCCLALGYSGIAWALEAAAELACRFDASEAQFGPPLMLFWRRAMPKLDMEIIKLAQVRDRAGLLERIRQHTAKHAPDTVLWAGEPLRLTRLAAELESLIGQDPAPALAAELRHLLQTMTGVDLARVWADGETIDPVGVRACLDVLRSHASYKRHEPGTRLFFGTPVG